MGSVDSLILEERSPLRWQQFLEGRLSDGRSPLLSVWSRSRRFNVDPRGPARVEQLETAQGLRQRRERSGPTWALVQPLFERLAARLADRDFVSLFTDPDGVVLWAAGGGRFREHAERVRLMEGAHWGEPVRGTNAIGTALLERRPVAVLGCAHFERTNHQLVCYGHPIVDAQGEIAGLLDVTSSMHRADDQVRLAVATAIDGMEQLLRQHAWSRAWGGFEPLLRVLHEHHGPAALVSGSGRVCQHNDAARDLLADPGGATFDRVLLEAAVRGELVPPVRLGGRDHRLVVEAIDESEALGYMVRLERSTDPRRIVAALRPDPRRRAQGRRARPPAFSRLLGDDPRLQTVLDHAARFARTDVPVLLLAETGTGKELLARAIHAESSRADRPLVAVNCGALTPELVTSELFGYRGGAFTGALRQGSSGLLAHADGGTLFLDEVAEMPPSLQAMLLRVLEDGTYSRVGEARVRRTDVRLVCATCEDLGQRVRAGAFRPDLYYRIRGATLTLPALRERSDLFVLVEALVTELAAAQGRRPPGISEPVRAWMRQHRWPGNIRELRATLEHATVLAGAWIELEHLPQDLVAQVRPSEPVESIQTPVRRRARAPVSRSDADAEVVRRAVEDAGGNLSKAARQLGVARSTLYRLLDRYGLR